VKLTENVAIAIHFNLRPPDATPVLIRCNYDAMPSLKSLNLSAAMF